MQVRRKLAALVADAYSHDRVMPCRTRHRTSLIEFALEVIMPTGQLAAIDRQPAIRIDNLRMLLGKRHFTAADNIGRSRLAAIRCIGLMLTRSAH
jgi:hypothetical protein